MHEEALFRDLRRKLEEIAREEHAPEISRVAVWIGALCHVDEAALRARWPETVEGTAARSARLEVTVSRDPNDARAGELVLTHVDIVEPGPRRAQEGP